MAGQELLRSTFSQENDFSSSTSLVLCEDHRQEQRHFSDGGGEDSFDFWRLSGADLLTEYQRIAKKLPPARLIQVCHESKDVKAIEET
jgi:hypothetical protein